MFGISRWVHGFRYSSELLPLCGYAEKRSKGKAYQDGSTETEEENEGQVRSGQLRHRVSIQQPIETQNAFGEPEVTWADVATGVWVEIRPLRGREYFAAKQYNSEIEAKIYLRYRSDVTAKMRVLHKSNKYYIDSIINVGERNRELQLMCTRSID